MLSSPTDDPDFAPRRAAREDLDTWAGGAIAQLDGAVTALRRVLETAELADATREMAERTIARAEPLRHRIHALAAEGDGALATRVHGDFHLGQVLVTGNDAYLIDFEGEPAKSMEERRAHSCPLRDVAGILRSFDYAAASAEIRANSSISTGASRLEDLFAAFRTVAIATFREAYEEVLQASAHQWVTERSASAMLDLFLLEKAAYEIRYEAGNRPDWLPIPLRGLDEIANRLLAT